jgi:5-formyltetrahydrofolate cyclo-ligase
MEKEEIRKKIWDLLETRNITDFPRPCYSRIPNFKGSRTVSEKIKDLSEFRKAHCVFCAPDIVLRRIREIVLEEGKVLAVALPHIKDILEIREIKGFRTYGETLKTKIDLFVQGSVAVDRNGNRLGKGKGYGDKEYFILKERGLMNDNANVVTLVHHLQIVDDISHLMGRWDIQIDYILTDREVIEATKGRHHEKRHTMV